MNVGELKEILKNEPDDRVLVVDIGDPPDAITKYLSELVGVVPIVIGQFSILPKRMVATSFGVDKENFEPIVLEL